MNELAYLPSSYTGSDVIFKFVGNSGYGPDVFFDNFLVEAIPTCPDPVPAAGTVTNNSASVSWTSPGSPLGSCVMWGPAGFYTGTGSVTGTIAHNVTSAYTISVWQRVRPTTSMCVTLVVLRTSPVGQVL